MSFESSAIAFNHSRATGTARLVLMGIASHDGDGGSWPSVARLSRYANATPRNVQKAIARLEALGEIRRFVQAGGLVEMASHKRPNRYEVLLKCPHDCDGTKNHNTPSESRAELPLEPVDNSTLHPLSVATPPVGSDTPPPVGSDTRTTPRTTPRYSGTGSSDRVRPQPVDNSAAWADARCPGDWKAGRHELHPISGKCAHCYEAPIEARA